MLTASYSMITVLGSPHWLLLCVIDFSDELLCAVFLSLKTVSALIFFLLEGAL